MNAALVGLVRDWMNDYDRKKEQADARSYAENQKAEERLYDESQKKEGRQYQEGRTVEGRKYSEDKSIKDREAALSDRAKADEQQYRESLIKFDKVYPQISRFFPQDYTSEQAFLALNKNPELSNVSQNVTALEGLNKGLPSSAVRTSLIANDATQAAARLKQVEDEARLPLAGQVATSGQRETLTKNMLGGQSPPQAFLNPNQTAYTTVGEDGKITVRENPYSSRINKDPLSGMIGGNNALKGVAESLGMEKYPMEFTPDGVPVQRKKPATATPSGQFRPTFTGNLMPQDSGVIDYGKPNVQEALKLSGFNVTPKGTVEAQPIETTSAFGTRPLIGGSRQPSDTEAKAMRQRAERIIRYYQNRKN